MNIKKPKLIVALDVSTEQEARKIINRLKDAVDIFKIGSQLFTAAGPEIVRYVLGKGKDVFLDLKFHDIPNTVAEAVRSVVRLNAFKKQASSGKVIFCTLHISGGEEMLKQAVDAAQKESLASGVYRPRLLGITVLTSDKGDSNTKSNVLSRALVAKSCGLDGVVSSVEEAALLRKRTGRAFIIVTPGIRPSGEDAQDQKRVATPKAAVRSGSNFLVVGRPIVKAPDPFQAALLITKEIDNP
ncbi:MAG: orotidine-5'-phosphate decarboxylase [Candidatus Omnitrophica bacterium]|nr:orotidine-5'-phosphate decarboxylase [Candidatus Omnitrophota bacterium]